MAREFGGGFFQFLEKTMEMLFFTTTVVCGLMLWLFRVESELMKIRKVLSDIKECIEQECYGEDNDG